MKAALLVRPGEIVVDAIPEPTIGPDDVSIAVGGVGLCGSDLSVFSGKWTAPAYPWVMGHEAFGTIDAVGAGVPRERIGQTVVVEPNVACFTCDQCRRGWTSACVARRSVGMNRQGALAERLVLPSRFAWPINGAAPTDLVCVEPTAVVLAALRRLGTPLPESAMVIGVGAQGLLMSLALVDRGVTVHAHDVNQDRVASAVGLGAVVAAVDESSPTFHLVVDTVGSPASVAVALSRLEVGGTLLVLGLDGRPLDLTAQAVVRRQLVLRGSLTYDHPDDFEAAIAAVRDGSFAPGRIVTDAYALDDAQLAFERSGSTAGKTWIRVGSDGETS
ncbi:MAG TPA: alcohol dehydrogenase catalytic domain-containing protein [Candidatus Limnocylindria bacterium]|nr:alcohol dehydrogenase catalytic domain-containing protein [Candidatus Limnocylindria bacterium]